MMLLPYDHLIIQSSLNPSQAEQTIASQVEPVEWFRWLGSMHEKPYQGQVLDSHFKMTRIIGYRNSFLPVISGRIRPRSGGSSIEITMRPYGFTLAFMAIWLGGVGYIFLNALADIVLSLLGFPLDRPLIPTRILIPGGMFAIGYALLMVGYKLEARGTQSFFRKLFSESGRMSEFKLSPMIYGLTDIQVMVLAVLAAPVTVVLVVVAKLMLAH